MLKTAKRRSLVRRMALACTVLVLMITSLSAYIRLGNAGLGCADWPQCYGSKLRQAQQGIDTKTAESGATVAARMAHRLVAVAALLLIILMMMTAFGGKPILWREGWMALALLLLALFLAVLGRWSGNARIPLVNVGNLLGGFAMLALCWRLQREGGDTPSAEHKSMTLLGWLALVVVVCQIASGGMVSAGFGGLSCTGMLECGAAEPVNLTVEALDPWREPVFASVAAPPANPAGAAIHMVHRGGAVVALLAVGGLAWATICSSRRRTGWSLLGLLGVEILLGIVLVFQSLPLGVALAHNLAAAMLLAALVALL